MTRAEILKHNNLRMPAVASEEARKAIYLMLALVIGLVWCPVVWMLETLLSIKNKAVVIRLLLGDSNNKQQSGQHLKFLAKERFFHILSGNFLVKVLAISRMLFSKRTRGLLTIDYEMELAKLQPTEVPEYYKICYHDIPGGYFNTKIGVTYEDAFQLYMDQMYSCKYVPMFAGMHDNLLQVLQQNNSPNQGRKLKLADFGCGQGYMASLLAKSLPQAQITGYDACPFFVIAAKHHYPHLSNLSFEWQPFENATVEHESLDALVSTFVIHELPNTAFKDLMRKAFESIKPGGVFLLADTAQEEFDDLITAYEPYKDHYLAVDVDEELRLAGFKTINTFHYGEVWGKLCFKSL